MNTKNPSLIAAVVVMIFIVILSNYLVQFPINDWLTLGSFTYPMSFLVTELTNRFFGPKKARQVIYVGFVIAVILSFWFATPRIALASGSAFLISQLLDVSIFVRLRQSTWWHAPFFASFFASLVDTGLFFFIAFYGEPIPVLTLALGDFASKITIDVGMLVPFRFALQRYRQNSV